MASTVTTKGQVVIPKTIRDRLDIKPGSTVDFEVPPDGRVFLVKKSARLKTAERVPTRFSAIRGTATVRLSTQQIMALTR